jgi:twitching motility protein PilT
MSELRRSQPGEEPRLPSASPLPESEPLMPRRGFAEADALLRAAVKFGASDLHLKSGQPPCLRIDGKLRWLDAEIRPSEQFEAGVLAFLTDEERQRLRTEGSVDLAYELDGQARFRINIYRQESGISLAARIVPRRIPSFDELHLPPVTPKPAESRRARSPVPGPPVPGKSPTTAPALEHINATRHAHIVTIEDPIEFLYTAKKCLINQRELGINVRDFPTALRALWREDPDIVLIGEMRDGATFQAAMQAADTGHLVFGTIHATGAAQTIERVLSLFPEGDREGVRQNMVFNLRAIVCQKLLKSTAEGVQRVPAVEVLISTPIIRKLITENRDTELNEVIRAGEAGMQSFTDSLYRLFQQKLIDQESGRQAAPHPEEYDMYLRGIRPSQRGLIG